MKADAVIACLAQAFLSATGFAALCLLVAALCTFKG